jgi:transposase
MATLQKRRSHGQTYWYIVESRRVNGKPRPVTLAYLGKAEDLLQRLTQDSAFELKSYSHGDVAALLTIAQELNLVELINRYVPAGRSGRPPQRANLTVGATLVLAAIGRACCPTSKQGWYEWCQTTSLEYLCRRSFKALDSQHFWDQMQAFAVEHIGEIEQALVKRLIETYAIELDTLLFDTSNFFTFIDTANERCEIAQRGKNKQKRSDLRQVGLALLVTRREQLPLFHHTYRGNRHDSPVWREQLPTLVERLQNVADDVGALTLVFDKGNNAKKNFHQLDQIDPLYYVASLVPSHFSALIEHANAHFDELTLSTGERLPVYRTSYPVWGKSRTCVVFISERLRQGQRRGIEQALKKKVEALETFKQQRESPRRRKTFTQAELQQRLDPMIRGQYLQDILTYELIDIDASPSFRYFIDQAALQTLHDTVLGRRILVTNREHWSSEEIILAYRAQTKVEFAFRTLKNPYHLAIRPQFHWTDQKIEAHFFICLLAYLMTMAAYTRAKNQGGYTRGIDAFMDDLRGVRLAAVIEQKAASSRGRPRIRYQLEKIPPFLQPTLDALAISDDNLRSLINFRVYK